MYAGLFVPYLLLLGRGFLRSRLLLPLGRGFLRSLLLIRGFLRLLPGGGAPHLLGGGSSNLCRCSPRLPLLVCRSPPSPQSWLAMGLGAAVSVGRGVPELCPHLAPRHPGSSLDMKVGCDASLP